MATRFITLALAAVAAASTAADVQKRAPASVIAKCTRPGVVALTFDDGPYAYTDTVLDLLGEAGMKATFFVNGQNWGSIYDYEDTVQRAVAEGHQIGSHTWSHPDIMTLSAKELTLEMTKLEDALVDIIGKYPVYMRPPFFSWDDENLETLGDLGYKVIHTDIDTLDWEGNMAASIENFIDGIDAGGSIVLAHEVHEATVDVLVPAMIRAVQASGLRAVTVGECLGDPERNWYSTRKSPPTDTKPTGPVPSDPVSSYPVSSYPVSSDPAPTETSVVTPSPSSPGPSETLSSPPSDPSTVEPSESSGPTSAPSPTEPTQSSGPTSAHSYAESSEASSPTSAPSYAESSEASSPTSAPYTESLEPSSPTTSPSSPAPTGTDPADPTYPEDPTPTDSETRPTKTSGSCRAKKLRRRAKRAAARRVQARK